MTRKRSTRTLSEELFYAAASRTRINSQRLERARRAMVLGESIVKLARECGCTRQEIAGVVKKVYEIARRHENEIS